MKNLFFLSAMFLFSACALMERSDQAAPRKEIRDVQDKSAQSDEEANPRKRLMVLPFLDANAARPGEWKEKSRAAFLRDLNKTRKVIALDSNDLNLDLSKYIKNNQYSLPEVTKAAQTLGFAAVLEGQVVDLRVKHKADPVGVFRQMKTTFECQVRVRIASVRSGKELFNTLKTVTIEEANLRVAEGVDSDRFFQNNPEIMENLMKEAFLDFTPQIVATMDKMTWEGKVAMIQGDRIFLNVGKISGLQIGDIVKVSDDGTEVYDPQSGNFIGRSPGRLKGTLEVISYFGQDGAISIIHSGAGFKENDRIELY